MAADKTLLQGKAFFVMRINPLASLWQQTYKVPTPLIQSRTRHSRVPLPRSPVAQQSAVDTMNYVSILTGSKVGEVLSIFWFTFNAPSCLLFLLLIFRKKR